MGASEERLMIIHRGCLWIPYLMTTTLSLKREECLRSLSAEALVLAPVRSSQTRTNPACPLMTCLIQPLTQGRVV